MECQLHRGQRAEDGKFTASLGKVQETLSQKENAHKTAGRMVWGCVPSLRTWLNLRYCNTHSLELHRTSMRLSIKRSTDFSAL
jgi:hypothetical protein